jgi:hypothetical protein
MACRVGAIVSKLGSICWWGGWTVSISWRIHGQSIDPVPSHSLFRGFLASNGFLVAIETETLVIWRNKQMSSSERRVWGQLQPRNSDFRTALGKAYSFLRHKFLILLGFLQAVLATVSCQFLAWLILRA